MFQELLALAVVLFFLVRLGWQFYKDQIPKNQFIFWLVFWFVTGLLVLFIKTIDQLAARFGFSSSGIQLLLYVAVAIIFYFIFRLRLKVASLEKDITKITQAVALNTVVENSKKYDS
ncbi:MAG: DUF2304 domain-containing protein [Candidatus Falkowbacteria bacterium]|nr:DUF2304 domain-containing protein [Candidatus Falkowbacteria bacterium]